MLNTGNIEKMLMQNQSLLYEEAKIVRNFSVLIDRPCPIVCLQDVECRV